MLRKLFLNDKVILNLILINAAIIFFGGFDLESSEIFWLLLIDNAITALFIAEMVVKIRVYGVRGYFRSNWNKFDFLLITLSIPALIYFVFDLDVVGVSYLLIFRVMRVFKSFRFLKFVPGMDHLINGVQRALKASVIVLVGFAVYIFIVGILSFYLFRVNAPEYFGNPLTSLYSIFKIFTVEGWFEIPEKVTIGLSSTASFFTYFYFIFILLTGGIFGLSLVNSIFVDAMVSDNTDELELKIDMLDRKLDELIAQRGNGEEKSN
ncbi:MAG: ion transporter [Cyclobacteriaceae bacterium]